MIDQAYAARAQFATRQAARDCCRAHGTTCPPCRKWDYESPRRLVTARNLIDAVRVVLGR